MKDKREYLKENNIINEALRLMDDSIKEAYEYLVKNERFVSDRTGQLYNFLYCLAALLDLEDEALKWLEEAIIDQKIWYRPEVFEDEDLDSIRDSLRFQKCVNLSNFRYENALNEAKSICTWQEKTKEDLLLVLHGNQQNINIARQEWEQFNEDYQVEYLQSSTLDSKNLYRWNLDGDGYKELLKALENIEINKYKTVTLGGFSAGCHVIIKALVEGFFVCDKVILQSPWIPEIRDNHKDVVNILHNHGIELVIICGSDDEDCLPLATTLIEASKENELVLNAHIIKDLGHEVPNKLKQLV